MSTGTDEFASERLRYRPLAGGDADLFVELYTDPRVMRHVAPALTPPAARRAHARVLAAMRAMPPAAWFLAIETIAGSERVGIVGCPDLAMPARLEIGIVLVPGADGRGYGREGLAAIAQQLFQRRATAALWTRIAPGNGAAIRMVESIGFQALGGPPGAAPEHGIWSLTRSDRAASATFGGHRNPAAAGINVTGRGA